MTNPTIIEVIGRSTQGMTRPFVCRADDGHVYYVKGLFAGNRSLVCEWMAGCLAQAFGLPIAPFAQLVVPEELIHLGEANGEPLTDLGAGLVFGSRRHEVNELTITTAGKVPKALQADVAVFDWWVHNEDRTLTAAGGNPNLFWHSEDGLLVIDHNLAFDPDFSHANFLETHVFRDEFREVASDFIMRGHFRERLSATLALWPTALQGLPESWHYLDPEQTIPLEFDFTGLNARLARCESEAFWNLS